MKKGEVRIPQTSKASKLRLAIELAAKSKGQDRVHQSLAYSTDSW